MFTNILYSPPSSESTTRPHFECLVAGSDEGMTVDTTVGQRHWQSVRHPEQNVNVSDLRRVEIGMNLG